MVVFSWKLIHNKLSIRKNVEWEIVFGSRDVDCVVCGGQVESDDRLFVLCEVISGGLVEASATLDSRGV